MLGHDIIRPSNSEWSSICVLVPKADGSIRFYTNYRKNNAVTKGDMYLLPKIVTVVGSAKFANTIDLLKGYWMILLDILIHGESIWEFRRNYFLNSQTIRWLWIWQKVIFVKLVEVILDFQEPKIKKELGRYLGMIGFYKIYCKNLARVVLPMIIKKGNEFNFSSECIDALALFCSPGHF